MQTYTDLQIILVNDGSTDKSAAIARTFVNSDSRFILLEQANQGQSAARNRGLKVAIGKYLVFVDADDYLDVDFIEQHLAALGTANYVQSGYRRVLADGTVLEHKQPCHRYQFTTPWARLYRMSVIRQYQLSFPEGMIYEDVIFSLNLWGTCPHAKMMNYCGYNYTYNPQSTTAQVNKDARKRLYTEIERAHAPWWMTVLTLIRLRLHFLFQQIDTR